MQDFFECLLVPCTHLPVFMEHLYNTFIYACQGIFPVMVSVRHKDIKCLAVLYNQGFPGLIPSGKQNSLASHVTSLSG
jgi:hypothetical protein